ncbi:unnamed protein product [Effrenium voratum]|nr:unnamed protein product [Effrenium voratum]
MTQEGAELPLAMMLTAEVEQFIEEAKALDLDYWADSGEGSTGPSQSPWPVA